MIRAWNAVVWLILIVVALISHDSAAQEAAAPEQEQLARLIRRLDSDRFEDRERAARELLEIGLPAVEALQAARSHPSAEVRWRARSLVDSLTANVRRRELADFAGQPDDRLDLEHGMWLIARILNPGVKQAELSKQLDNLAHRVAKKLDKGELAASAEPEKAVAVIRQVLFVEVGFTGNTNERYHPDNSSLERVLQTKKGLPIVLSHLTIAVARRLDLPLVGVPLSGTYIVKYDASRAPVWAGKDDLFIDPFENGRLLHAGDELERAFPGQDATNEAPLNNRETLERMLRNLASSLTDRKDGERLEQAEEFLQMLSAYGPDAGPE
jgi:regulator of sirC expression with transglutaminase-like and TPR domain